jgi:thymidine phosphorylase
LEVKEALQVLEGRPPSSSTHEKSIALAGILLEMGGFPGNGKEEANRLLRSGAALHKFWDIIEAQGTEHREITSEEVGLGKFSEPLYSPSDGYVSSINNKTLVRIARAAGCPSDKMGGIVLSKKIGHQVERGEEIFRVFSSNEQKLKLAIQTARKLAPFQIEGMVLERVPAERVLHAP